ncbi:hypothetical protein B0T22DRAFT_99932 [Podospora appendiculata]|uniref:Uncharacterized protein n=1 Tax=Podospora appendiculata TaxID=314037 RepID=A0AAE0XKS1_9PEZI|nr:hypothetical protein B0T22DRAFT_99932 [Podospora appendiculata]
MDTNGDDRPPRDESPDDRKGGPSAPERQVNDVPARPSPSFGTVERSGKEEAEAEAETEAGSPSPQPGGHGSPGKSASSQESLRSHNEWVPRFGKVQKCDFCSERSKGILYRCSKCSLHICETCATEGKWKGDNRHFIDSEVQNWDLQRPARTTTASRASKRSRSASVRGTSIISPPIEPDSPPIDNATIHVPKRPRREQAALSNDHAASPNPRSATSSRSGQNLSPASPHQTAQPRDTEGLRTNSGHDALSNGAQNNRQRDNDVDEMASPSIQPASQQFSHSNIYTAAASRPSVRASAAMALERINKPIRPLRMPRQPRCPMGDDDEQEDEEPDKDEYTPASRNQASTEPPHPRRPSRSLNTSQPSRNYAADNLASSIEQSSRAPYQARARAPESTPLQANTAGYSQAQQPRPRSFLPPSRERSISGIYQQIFGGEPPNLDHIITTPIPESWEGPWLIQPIQPVHQPRVAPLGPDPSPFNLHPQPRTHEPSEHEIHSQRVFEATTQFRPIPPTPRGYQTYSFNYVPRHSRESTPTARTTPRWSAHNEFTAEQLQVLRNDRMLLDQMREAWNENPEILRIRNQGGGGDMEALQTLWDVFEVRRNRVTVHYFSQAIRWFVEHRNLVNGVYSLE